MRQYRVWQAAEQEALRQGVLMHGTGAWEVIRTDPNFRQTLCAPLRLTCASQWRARSALSSRKRAASNDARLPSSVRERQHGDRNACASCAGARAQACS